MKLTELTMTCGACPAQWEGKLEDGRHVYARYRHGWLEVAAAPSLDIAVFAHTSEDALQREVLVGREIGDQYDGMMSTEDMLRHAELDAP